jgi:2-polyprenyl-3-methyl-5-hydroxy-6-metoxy-1,4-benzoquinol methylase
MDIHLTKHFVVAPAVLAADRHPNDNPATVFLNGTKVGEALPVHLDRNLKRRSLMYWFPKPLQSGDIVGIRQRLETGADSYLEAEYRVSSFPTLSDIASIVVLPDWAIDAIEISNGSVSFSGWILPSRNRCSLDICVNDEQVRMLSIFPGREDVVKVWQSIGSLSRPLAMEGQIAVGDLHEEDLKFELKEDGRSFALSNVWFPTGKSRYPIPDEARRERVCGSSDKGIFLRSGFTNYHRLMTIIDSFLDSPANTSIRILDWGCGCGGIGRYLMHDNRWLYTGLDIDYDNIQWCKDNIDGHAFEVGPLRPPTRFCDDSFDVVLGHSVFTHLHEADQLLWLAELSRIISAQGIGIFTVLGVQAVAKVPLLQRDAEFLRSGFLFSEDHHVIGRLVGEESYYGTAYHHYGYIATMWSVYFDVLAYIPAGFSHQDVIVVRPKAYTNPQIK